jgi:hypothetical protein
VTFVGLSPDLPGDNSLTGANGEVLQGSSSTLLAPKGVNKLATPLGNKDLAVMANLLDLSVKLWDGYTRKRCLVDKRLFMSCFRKTGQGVIRIKE